jgi:hypothetical protein
MWSVLAHHDRRRVVRALAAMLAAACCLVPGVAGAGSGQVTFSATTTGGQPRLWRIEARVGAVPENLTTRLDAISTHPGAHFGPISVSANGAWYVFHSERFDADSQGWAGLTIAPASFASAETIKIDGQTIHAEGLAQVANNGAAVVYGAGGGPHGRDLFLVRKQGGIWTGPVLLTADSHFEWNYRPVLSRDGTRIAFDAGDTSFPSTALCEVRLTGDGFRVLVSKDDGPAGQTSPAVHSPGYARDGGLIFEAEWGGGERVWRRAAAGGVPTQVHGAYSNDNSPAVLPDGRIVSLWLNAPDGGSGHQIKVMGATGLSAFMLTSTASPFPEVDDVGLGAGALPVDTTAPSVVHVRPATVLVSTLPQISGTSADNINGAGVWKVRLRLRRTSDLRFWNGTAWQTSSAFLNVSGTTSWSVTSALPVGTNLPNGGYEAQAYAYDNAGNLRVVTRRLTVDSTAPASVVFTSPVANATISALTAIRGTAADNPGGSGIAEVSLRLRRLSDLKYWDGAAWTTTAVRLAASGTTSWSRTSGLPSGANLPAGRYEIFAFAYDRAGNVRSVKITVTR